MSLLAEHGDTQAPPGHLDLAVNVHPEPPPGWPDLLEDVDVTAYPDPSRARDLLAARHGVEPDEVLLVNGAAEAFWALAHATTVGLRISCVHPSFTAPEAAFRSAGHRVHRIQRHADDGFRLQAGMVPRDADVVVLGRPDNPTGTTTDLATLTAVAREDRVLVVDEAFAEHTGDGLGLAAVRRQVPGLVQVRSLTKVWGIAGLRLGYVVADPALLGHLATTLQPWPVNAVALALVQALFHPANTAATEAERMRRTGLVHAAREVLVPALRTRGLAVWAGEGNFVLVRSDLPDLRMRLLARGVAVRRGDTFPGLDEHWVRIALHPDPMASTRLLVALDAVLERP